jgi:hypothetical protein
MADSSITRICYKHHARRGIPPRETANKRRFTYSWARPKQPQTDVAANASNETAQAVKDLQTTEQKIAGQMQSLQQAIASNQAETKQTLAAEQEAGLIKAVDAGREAKPAGDSP